jgi:CDP-glucose 4,6-dehydratase
MTLFAGAYRGRRVLVTGHTGFKGSWLVLWLHEMGADVVGLALEPETHPSHWALLGLPVADHRADIRDPAAVARIVQKSQPELVIHLAAQSLVRRSYRDPLATWSANVMGTAHLLEACRTTPSVRAVLVVTSDKVYANQEWPWGYRENDRIGGHDPYSASKAATELLCEGYRRAFFQPAEEPLVATARAGNVIGGGDWAEDRLIPDLARAVSAEQKLEIRSPQATRPWQHVLDCLGGYLLLGQRLLAGDRACAGAWNFGPDAASNLPVAEVLERLKVYWPGFEWEVTRSPQPHEAGLLYLESAKARRLLGWRPVWGVEDAIAATAHWYRRFGEEGSVESRAQLAAYLVDARGAGAGWVAPS